MTAMKMSGSDQEHRAGVLLERKTVKCLLGFSDREDLTQG